MNLIKISKSNPRGKVRPNGAKNSGLKLLTDVVVEIYNAPIGLLDMQLHIKILNRIVKTCVKGDRGLKIEENIINPEL